MAKRYAVLQKKLEELESELNDVFKLQVESHCHQLVSESIDRRFSFLRSLLSAEIESRPYKPHHLHHIDQRLTELETAFHDWDDFRTSTVDHIDTASECSCTESCLNEDGNGSFDMGSPVLEDPESVSEGVVMEEKPIAVVIDEVEGDMKKEKRVWIGIKRRLLMFVLVVLGVVITRFSGWFYYKGEMKVFPSPT